MLNFFKTIHDKKAWSQRLFYYRKRFRLWLFSQPFAVRMISNTFMRLYYDARHLGRTWSDTYWLGVKTEKCPFDLWLYQQLIATSKPDFIIETGTLHGGSARFMCSVMDQIDHGQIITIDIAPKENRPTHPRLTYLTGSSAAESIFDQVKDIIQDSQKVMVILDSDHTKEHVLKEMELFGPLVKPGYYMIVEDSCINGHPVSPHWGPGPMEAIKTFLKTHKEFEVDHEMEKTFLMTFNPHGFLKRV